MEARRLNIGREIRQLAVGLLLCCGSVAGAQLPAPDANFITKYCASCHGGIKPAGGLSLKPEALAHLAAEPSKWEMVAKKLRAGAMPPLGVPRPAQTELGHFVDSVEAALDHAAPAVVAHTGPRRLNRAEYAASVRDLLDLEIDAAALLPADDANQGFDNAASAQLLSPARLDAYLNASRKISALAVGLPDAVAGFTIYRAKPDLGQDHHLDGLPLGTRGGLLVRHNFPLDAEYVLRTKLVVNTSAKVRGLDFPHDFVLTLDGRQIHRARVGGAEDEEAASVNSSDSERAITKRLEIRMTVPAGPHTVGAAFVMKSGALEDGVLEPFSRSSFDTQEQRGVPIVDSVQIGGPFEARGAGDTPSRRKVFVCRPASERESVPCARKILMGLARRAYRRPVAAADTEMLLSLYQQGRNEGPAVGFDAGIANALRFLLASPEFLYRTETVAGDSTRGARVNDLALASRLSFFLWSSLPDEELLGLATAGKLRAPGQLERQVRRMLSDKRSHALAQNFAGQWLYLRNLAGTSRDLESFPNFDDNLRQGFRRETELFFSSIVAEDRSVLDLLRADYTFVNDRLAAHYGIPNVAGSQFRRVKLSENQRRGLLGQGSVLTVTSYSTRTSPVLRGKWVLENILGTPVPPPPPGVPALAENRSGEKPRSVRERLEEHRKNPACSVCHNLMDPLGFALENFDATGAWRTRSESHEPVDAAGMLVDGTPVNGPAALRDVILAQPETVVRTVTEKLMTYAMGRGVEAYDMPAVRQIVRSAAPTDYRFSNLIFGIVSSAPFQAAGAATNTASKEVASK